MGLKSLDYRKRMFRTIDTIVAVAVSSAAVVLVVYLVVGRWGLDGEYMVRRFPAYFLAAMTNLYYTGVAFGIGLFVGLLIGWVRAARATPLDKVLRDARKVNDASFPTKAFVGFGARYLLRRTGDAFVSLIRGTPLFVQIMFAAAILRIQYPQLNPLLIGVIAGFMALTLNTAGYQSEIFRAGFQTVHSGQVEAARAIGFSRSAAMRYVVLPQALRLVIPPLTNEFIGLLKASSLLLIIGIVELTLFGRREAFSFFVVFEAFALVTGIYLLLTVPVSKVVEWIERRYRIPGLGIQPGTVSRA